MKKMNYIAPQVAVEAMVPDMFVMFPESPGDQYNPAPARRPIILN